MIHADVPNLLLADPARLPFKDQSFGRVVCSHAMEHIHDPEALMEELDRVGREVTLIVPPFPAFWVFHLWSWKGL